MNTASTPPTSLPPNPTIAAGILDRYATLPGVSDAMRRADGSYRRSWRKMTEHLANLSPETLNHRQRQAQQILDDNGILLAGPFDASKDFRQPHPWPLDPIPFQFSARTFQGLSDGITQRARLLNRLVADLLGPQRVLKERILPPALLFANPYYHRAYHGLPVSGDRFIHLYGIDVARGEDGRWWAMGDRTQAPSGLGYTLENRIVSARINPGWFQSDHVKRHARFFSTLRETLNRLAARNAQNPHIVLLSQGLRGHRGFEDAFLARYMGFTLAVGEDLAVRRGQTILKTLGGAVPVEVILRRINDERMDPVELRPDATQGVSGIVESQRLEHVSIANMLGSQLVEAPGMLAFLNPLQRFFFGDDLKLPSIATWWCGHDAERAHVLNHLDELYIRPAFDANAPTIDPTQLTAEARDTLIADIQRRGEMFIGQQRLQVGTTPAWQEGRLAPKFWDLRTFAVLGETDYQVLPGGLVRLAATQSALDLETTAELQTQDCWVLSDRPVDTTSLMPPSDRPTVLKRGSAELPSRVADHFYWLGRSIETAEGLARLLRSLLARAEGGTADALRPMPTSGSPLFSLVSKADPEVTDHATLLIDAALNEPKPGNLRESVRECVRIAQVVRDRISLDAWRLLTRMQRYLDQTAKAHAETPTDLTETSDLLNHLILELVGFGGLMSESMTRTLGWRFLDLGRRTQRAIHSATMLRTALVQPGDQEYALMDAILEVSDSTMTYRARYLADLRPVPVLDLLLNDETNPRSVAYQLIRIDEHLDLLPRDGNAAPRDPDQNQTNALINAVRVADPAELVKSNDQGVRQTLEQLLTQIVDGLPIIEHAVAARFLVHAELPHYFARINPRRFDPKTSSDAKTAPGAPS